MNIASAEFKDATLSTAKGRRLSIRTSRPFQLGTATSTVVFTNNATACSAGSADTYTRILENHRPPTSHDLTSNERPGQTTRLSTDTMEHASTMCFYTLLTQSKSWKAGVSLFAIVAVAHNSFPTVRKWCNARSHGERHMSRARYVKSRPLATCYVHSSNMHRSHPHKRLVYEACNGVRSITRRPIRIAGWPLDDA